MLGQMTMVLLLVVVAVAIIPTTTAAFAFVVKPRVVASTRTPTRTSSKLFVANDFDADADADADADTSNSIDRILAAGGGLPVVPSGDCLLFDPAIEGKLGGSGILEQRLQHGVAYDDSFIQTTLEASSPETVLGTPITTITTAAPPATTTTDQQLVDAQHWLEDIGVPSPFAKNNKPVEAKLLGRTRLIGDDAPGDIQHILLQLPKGMHYVEGQSISVIPPGINEQTGKPLHKPRLYSIASTRYGDLLDGQTVSLCVRRAQYMDPITNQPDPTKQGICSNFLCNATPGQTIQVAGPVGKTMLLPTDPNKDIIMVATGTGIAPFRAFLHRLFMEHTVARHMFTGSAWLILGVPTTSGLLYPQEIQAMQQNALPGQLRVNYAISREMTNAIDGGKLYVQHVLAQHADELLSKLESGAVIYFCGLKGMMPGILESLEQVCASRGLDFATQLAKWQANHQWHVEVY